MERGVPRPWRQRSTQRTDPDQLLVDAVSVQLQARAAIWGHRQALATVTQPQLARADTHHTQLIPIRTLQQEQQTTMTTQKASAFFLLARWGRKREHATNQEEAPPPGRSDASQKPDTTPGLHRTGPAVQGRSAPTAVPAPERPPAAWGEGWGGEGWKQKEKEGQGEIRKGKQEKEQRHLLAAVASISGSGGGSTTSLDHTESLGLKRLGVHEGATPRARARRFSLHLHKQLALAGPQD